MLARRSTLIHPLVGAIELPLIVPAFSSKGFALIPAGKGNTRHDYSEIAYELSDFGKRPSRSVLLSGYDLHFGHFDAPELPQKMPEIHLRNSQVVFLDSGGYELTPGFDQSEIKVFRYTPKDGYGRQEYESVLQRLVSLRRPLPLLITNFDFEAQEQPLIAQIKLARALFNKFRGCMSDFIIKLWKGDKKRKIVEPSDMTDTDFSNLRGFDIIGVTEKELGRDIFERIRRIAKLRQRLDHAKINAPIHIWGGLDPILTPYTFLLEPRFLTEYPG